MSYKADSVAPPQIEQAILLVRGQRVMLDRDLAAMYGVTTGNLNKAVQRNESRFRADFMFRLTADEAEASRFQIGILKKGLHFKYLPCVLRFLAVFGGMSGVRVRTGMGGTSTLSPTLSPRRGNDRSPSLVLGWMIRPIPSLESSRKRGTIPPLPGGEGWGEGERYQHFSCRCPDPLLPTESNVRYRVKVKRK